MKIVHSKIKKKKRLNHEELIAKINTKGTVQEREQVVIDNLKGTGLKI